MYDAKAKGGGGLYRVFDQASMGTRSSERLQLETDLRKALERDEFEVHYQPFYSLASLASLASVADQRIVGAEALVRWRHPANGLISPAKLIPMAEETGLILRLGRHVLETACRQARSVRDRLGVDLPVSVNLSPRQFQESGLLSQVAEVLDATGLPPSLLIFEITETMVMQDLSGAREVMKKLRGLGVRLAIDDFGTGHSSLGYLKQFPVDEVKVDRTFVQGVADSPVDSAIVRAVIDLANAMGITAVAEGVETREQVARLTTLGCQVAQGFYFSRPLPASEFDDLLTTHFGNGNETGVTPVAGDHEDSGDRQGQHRRNARDQVARGRA
jgi:EAL domain-containing protein (putative c-di-GMP-specific phosphodiesterase class I)